MTVAGLAANRGPVRDRQGSGTVKRVFDVVLGGSLALVSLPFIAVFAIGVAISLRAWPFFSHLRPGRDGAPMTMIKIRTLPPSTPTYADKQAIHIDDMPLPWLCRALRKTHLDELPQLFLATSGKMSLVGPRPGQLAEVERFDDEFEALRTSVRPGCTGLWQIGVGAHGSIADNPEFDLFYIDNATVRLDIWILLRTVPWLFGLVQPIELENIPQWLLRRQPTADALPGTASVELPDDVFPVDSRDPARPTTDSSTWALEQRHGAGAGSPDVVSAFD